MNPTLCLWGKISHYWAGAMGKTSNLLMSLCSRGLFVIQGWTTVLWRAGGRGKQCRGSSSGIQSLSPCLCSCYASWPWRNSQEFNTSQNHVARWVSELKRSNFLLRSLCWFPSWRGPERICGTGSRGILKRDETHLKLNHCWPWFYVQNPNSCKYECGKLQWFYPTSFIMRS